MKRVWLAVFLVLGAGPALASGRDPQLPDSGIVIHLFGPEAGIPEQKATAEANPAAPPSIAGAPGPDVSAAAAPAPAGQAPSEAAPGASAPASTQSAYPEPQLGTILHQMFITGDPNRGSGFSPGREKAY